MPAPTETDHDRARALGEAALDALAENDPRRADRLIAEAKQVDPSALREIVAELDEDAGADPDIAEKLPG